MPRLLILGGTGKLGTALAQTFRADHDLIALGSADVDAADPISIAAAINSNAPDIVANCVAALGVDACERAPTRAYRINALLPRQLALLSRERGFRLIHFSTESVFDNAKSAAYVETDLPNPLNVYGFTKYVADCLVERAQPDAYIFRLPMLFGPAPKARQFVERMLERAAAGPATIRVSTDVYTSPSYSLDVAAEVRRIMAAGLPSGLYHVANSGRTSLYDLMREIVGHLDIPLTIERGSNADFPGVGEKNLDTALASSKLPPLRRWQDGAADYCRAIRERR